MQVPLFEICDIEFIRLNENIEPFHTNKISWCLEVHFLNPIHFNNILVQNDEVVFSGLKNR